MSQPQPLPVDLAEPLARAAGRLGPFGTQVFWYPEISSTNDIAMSLADRGAPEGVVVAANAQTAGRGRLGRRWSSPPGTGLYVSTVLRPAQALASILTVAAGVAIADGIEAATGLRVQLKWPNDVFVDSRKLAGILAEASSPGGALPYVVVGFGINVMPAAHPRDIAARATNVEEELGRPVDRGLLLVECLCALARRYADVRDGRAREVMTSWHRRASAMLGRKVQFDGGGSRCEGIAEGIEERGALIVRTHEGAILVTSGEVIWS